MKYQVSKHLGFATDQDDRTCAIDLLSRKRMVYTDQLREVFRRHQEPRELDSEIAKDASIAELIVPIGEPPQSKLTKKIRRAWERFVRRDETLTRKREDLLLEESEWGNPDVAVTALMEHLEHFLNVDSAHAAAYSIDPELVEVASRRPSVKLPFEQQPCSLATTQARIDLIAQRHEHPTRVLVLGEDDLVGISLAQQKGFTVDIYEIDRELVEFLRPLLPENANIVQRDLAWGLLQEHLQEYDVIFTDPAYLTGVMEMFLDCCKQGLSNSPRARVYLATAPRLLQSSRAFFSRLQHHRFEIEERLNCFNRYPMPPSGLQAIEETAEAEDLPSYLRRALVALPYLYADLFILKTV